MTPADHLTETVRQERLGRVRARMGDLDLDALLLSIGADLPWLTGYQAMPLERLTMLVVPADDLPTLVVPSLEAPRVEEDETLFTLCAWNETDDPIAVVAGLLGSRTRLAVSDRTWAMFVLELQARMPSATWTRSSTVMSPLRAVKDRVEMEILRRASAAADRVAAQLVEGEIAMLGRSEAEVSADLGRRLMAEGHQKVNFAIVGSGPYSASPHHEPGRRRIGPDEAVVCDFGGTLDGYCSDITRTVFTGEPPADFRDLYAVLQAAQAAAVEAATIGTPCEDVDGVARRIIEQGGYGPHFMHRTGHGIGMEEHEDPYLVGGNCEPLAAGHAFSVEPGIYLRNRWGARIEDIVIATDNGPEALNTVSHELAIVEA